MPKRSDHFHVRNAKGRISQGFFNGVRIGSIKRVIEDALSSSYIAFVRNLKKGPDEGRSLLCFTKDSLLRFLRKAELNKRLLPAFIDRCREMGVYCDRKNVCTSTQTIDVKAFYIDELSKCRLEGDE